MNNTEMQITLTVPSSDYLFGAEESVDGQTLVHDETIDLFAAEHQRLWEEYFPDAEVNVFYQPGYGSPVLKIDGAVDEDTARKIQEDFKAGYLPEPDFSEEKFWVYR